MTKLKYYIPVLGLIILLGSCTTYRSSIPQSSVQAQVNINMSDLEYIKDVTASTTQSYVIGLPLGGTKYKSAVVSSINSGLLNLPSLGSRGMNNAIYNALQQAPDADFILPISTQIVSNRMFMGRQDSIIVRAKVFKLKQQ